jgi:hypothetical protein
MNKSVDMLRTLISATAVDQYHILPWTNRHDDTNMTRPDQLHPTSPSTELDVKASTSLVTTRNDLLAVKLKLSGLIAKSKAVAHLRLKMTRII